MTSLKVPFVPEVLGVHVVPSEEVKTFPALPTATNVLFPYATPLRLLVVPEVLSVQVVPSDEVRMIPESPTITNVPFT